MPASFNSFSFLNSSCFRKSSALRSTSYIGGKKDKSANNADTPYTHPAVTIRSSKCISSGKKNKKQYFDSYASTQLIVLNRTWAQRPHQVGIPRPPAPSTSPPPGSWPSLPQLRAGRGRSPRPPRPRYRPSGLRGAVRRLQALRGPRCRGPGAGTTQRAPSRSHTALTPGDRLLRGRRFSLAVSRPPPPAHRGGGHVQGLLPPVHGGAAPPPDAPHGTAVKRGPLTTARPGRAAPPRRHVGKVGVWG